MDISKNFTDSLTFLKKNIAIPFVIFISNFVFFGIMLLAFFAFAAYFSTDIENFQLTVPFVVSLAGACILLAIIMAYLGCAYWTMVALAVNGKKLSFKSVISAANSILFRFLYLNFLIAVVLVSPLLFVVILIVCAFFLNKILGIVLLILSILLFIAYVIFMAIRTIFAIPIMFMEGAKARDSILIGFSITKGRFKDAGLVFIIIVAVSLLLGFSGGFTSNSRSIFGALFSGMSFVIIYALSAISTTFIYTFLFYSYKDFKKDGGPKAGRLPKKAVR